MSVEREMSLAEWCAKLPNQHKVNQELAVLNKQLAAAQKELKSVAMALCRWKCGNISGDELATELFAVFASAPSIEATQGKEGE